MRPAERSSTEADAVEVIFVTAPGDEVAHSLARGLVEARLAACVNLVPGLRSIYRYEGRLHDDAEVLLVVKTCAARASALEAFVREQHPYDLPELVRIPVAGGSAAYLDWVREGCAP
ncbi:MAG: divalent-cation tolerance protein CutA [Myxococcota bacterium]